MKRKVGAARMPVTVEEAKAHLRVEGNDEDALLERLLLAAQAVAESFCMTDFMSAPPEPVRLAILLHAGHFYTHRESGDVDTHAAMLRAFESLLWPYREPANLF